MEGNRGRAMVTRSKDAVAKGKKMGSTAGKKAASTSVLPRITETRTTELRKQQTIAATSKMSAPVVTVTRRLSQVPSKGVKDATVESSSQRLLKNVQMSGAGPRNIEALRERRKVEAARDAQPEDGGNTAQSLVRASRSSISSVKSSDSKLAIKPAVPVKRLAVTADDQAKIKKTRFMAPDSDVPNLIPKDEVDKDDQEESLKDVFFTPFNPRPKISVDADPELQRNIFGSPSFEEHEEEDGQPEQNDETSAVPEAANTSEAAEHNKRWSCLLM